MRGYMPVPLQKEHLRRLEAISRTRALTDAESAIVERLVDRERQRGYRAAAARRRALRRKQVRA
ncbi:hypothetical protein [Sphingomonas sp. 8AM]|uniref:hypothetical protein n=1 Tax=Sphingomonas sp. 8AM TaxID=2653170 RepID=UPI0012F1B7C8|nr:hypothetical protein [Sphingomonas sp. 8AM]VXC80192.1 conserved hypothetical protein [Sphingomonas sp. 8AM]